VSDISERIDKLSPVKRALFELQETRASLSEMKRAREEPIAIVGMACRFPGGVDNPDAYWELLRNGVDAVTEVPPDRWDLGEYYDADPNAPGKMYTRHGGFLTQIDRFDSHFFGIAPREAMSMDPQQRVLLEVSWEALERAGLAPDRLGGTPTSVFVGISTSDYAYLGVRARSPRLIDAYSGTGGSVCITAGRLAYTLGLRGPALALDTACSSSLVAVHLAVGSLRSGESRLALVAGVNLMLMPDATVYFCKVRALAADGRCKTFDAAADGYVRGEGCGVVVLKRLSDALADGDQVLALIRGSSVNQDGHSNGLTAPNLQAQEAVIRSALAAAGIEPAQVGYVEAHGTGTPLGDPIEVQALAAALGAGRPAERPLLVGSVKTNFGHLEAAAGVAGLIKAVLVLQHGHHAAPHIAAESPR
jgi:acyl transferase domain-containing protein